VVGKCGHDFCKVGAQRFSHSTCLYKPAHAHADALAAVAWVTACRRGLPDQQEGAWQAASAIACYCALLWLTQHRGLVTSRICYICYIVSLHRRSFHNHAVLLYGRHTQQATPCSALLCLRQPYAEQFVTAILDCAVTGLPRQLGQEAAHAWAHNLPSLQERHWPQQAHSLWGPSRRAR
jgi:hypothetical protein